ncbi:MAG TPA: type III effector protein, partial [Burkholderiaceae bacterium]|nr:type III effector protein [Burkholderiaceae bacterium]
IATKKSFALGGLMGSLAVSSGLGTAWELGLAPAIKSLGQKLLEQAGMPSPTRALLTAAMGTGVDSIPPVVIESMDTLCVLAILKTMKGDDDWTLKSLVPNALKAGAISSALSIPNNLMQYLSTGSGTADLAVGALTTEAAIFGAASGVPMEIQESKDAMHAALVQSHRDGLFAPVPQDADPRQYVAEMAQRALDVDPSTSLAQKSMAVAATVGMVPLLLGDKALNLVPESVLRIVRSTVFNPIEAIALNALVLSARAKLPGIFTSDHDKHASLVQRILQRAGDAPDGGQAPIQPRELDRIFNPPQEVLGRAGTAISATINAMVSAPAKGAQWLATKIGATADNRSQEQPLPYESLHQPDGAEAV